MDAARYARVMEIFLAVHALPPPERAAALDNSCAGDVALKEEVASLLAHDQTESLLAPRAPEAEGRRALSRETHAKWSEEQRLFLSQRIRVLGLILSFFVVVLLWRNLGLAEGVSRVTPHSLWALAFGVVCLAAACLLAFVMRGTAWAALRRQEMAIVTACAVTIGCLDSAWLRGGVALESPPSAMIDDLLREAFWVISPGGTTHTRSIQLAFQVTNHWGTIAALYGIIIPNTLRRGAGMLAGLSATATAIVLASLLQNPAVRPYAVENALYCGFFTTLYGLIGLYIGVKFQALRKAVFDAKQVGQYELMQLLGKGAMGEVYLARHRLLRRPCAVKLIRPDRVESQEWLSRFEREVQAMAQLTHPNTVEVYDFGRAADDSFFYAMEYLPGSNLDALVRRFGPLPPGRVVHLLRQVCGALAEAHGKGLIHRDIKPGNVIVCERGGVTDVVKLLDFGLVHVQTDVGPEVGRYSAVESGAPEDFDGQKAPPSGFDLTRAGQIIGTPAYMAPEQVRGEPPDARSDIYSLGGVACFLLTGKPPFEGDTLEELCRAHLSTPSPRLCDRDPNVPADLSALIERCLAKLHEERFQHVKEVLAALEATDAASEWGSGKAEAWWRAHSTNCEFRAIATTCFAPS